MLADPSGAFTRALGDDMLRPPEAVFGGVPRSRRYSAVVDQGRFTHVNVEPAGGAVCSVSDVLITQL
jgi:peroxiredoxin